ncbi:MAG: TetR/AcrR family transcriptional regulator [Candidatus Izimaplasma sp.]|nr:TetR/AcrR family transcriptional regulator [Candidatus Izimaplasma bacterium]
MKKDKTQLLRDNEALFQETLNEFSSKPFDLASVNEIIKRSKFNKGSFYYRFKDKLELYIALMDYIFVEQIDLFRQNGLSLNSLSNLNDILYSMFSNLIDLYNKDERYFKVVQNLYTDKSNILFIVNDHSIESLYNRFLIKLKSNSQYNQELEEVIKSLYINFPIEKITNDSIKLEYILDLINPNKNDDLKSSDIKVNSNLSEEIFSKCNDKINYFIGDFSNIDISFNTFNIYEQLKSVNTLHNSLKFKKINPFISTESMLNKYKNKPIFNSLAVEKILDKENFRLINEDELLRNITFLVVYAIIDLSEFIVFDDFVEFLSNHQLYVLFDLILPINGKLSKIVFLDQYLYLNLKSIKKYYILNSLGQLEPFNLNDNFYNSEKIYNLKYEKNGKIYNIYLENFDRIVDIHNDSSTQIIYLNTIKKMSYKQLIESR